MRFYHVTDGANRRYCTTLAEAHATAKLYNRDDVEINEVEVPSDKDNVARLLNADGGFEVNDPDARRWVLTPRGGLRELKEE